MKPRPPIETIRQLLICDPVAGTLVWRIRSTNFFKAPQRAASWNKRFAGKPALAAMTGGGYCHGKIFGKFHSRSCVIWAMENGAWPNQEIDHEDHVRTNDKLANLFEKPHSENCRNQSLAKTNTSGACGVSWHKRIGKWAVYIGHGPKTSLGYFDEFKDAIAARKAAESERGYHRNHGTAPVDSKDKVPEHV